MPLGINTLAQSQNLLNNPYSFEVPSGCWFRILVVFQDPFPAIINRTAHEAAMSFWQVEPPNDPHYPLWPGCGNYDNTHRRDFQGWNGGGSPIIYAFNAGHKDTPPDVNNPIWNFSPGVIESETTTEEGQGPLTTTVISYPDTEITVQVLIKRKNLNRNKENLKRNKEKEEASTIVFHNLFHRDAIVQLREAAPSFDCGQNRSLGSITVPAQGEAPFQTSENICFRRDIDPDNPTGVFTQFLTVDVLPPPEPPQVIDINI